MTDGGSAAYRTGSTIHTEYSLHLRLKSNWDTAVLVFVLTNTLLQNVSLFVCPLVDYKSRSHGKSNVYAVYQGSRPKVVRPDRVNWQFV